MVFFDSFELPALVPGIKEYEEIIGRDTKYNKNCEIVENIEVRHAHNILANQTSGTERECNNQHGDKSQECRF
jgi:hypothetical protein